MHSTCTYTLRCKNCAVMSGTMMAQEKRMVSQTASNTWRYSAQSNTRKADASWSAACWPMPRQKMLPPHRAATYRWQPYCWKQSAGAKTGGASARQNAGGWRSARNYDGCQGFAVQVHPDRRHGNDAATQAVQFPGDCRGCPRVPIGQCLAAVRRSARGKRQSEGRGEGCPRYHRRGSAVKIYKT